jgi:hypothetical protein
MKGLRNAAVASVAIWVGKNLLSGWRRRRLIRSQPIPAGGDGYQTEPPTPRA